MARNRQRGRGLRLLTRKGVLGANALRGPPSPTPCRSARRPDRRLVFRGETYSARSISPAHAYVPTRETRHHKRNRRVTLKGNAPIRHSLVGDIMRTFVTFFLSAMLALPADLPVRQVVLYKHGVGFFERSGRLGSGESARLDFNASEMNDVLKSLTVAEKGGGKISGLRYDSMDLLGHKLAEFPFKIGEEQPLSAILGQLKGARIELKFGNETIVGAIVGGRLIPGSDKQAE